MNLDLGKFFPGYEDSETSKLIGNNDIDWLDDIHLRSVAIQIYRNAEKVGLKTLTIRFPESATITLSLESTQMPSG